MGILKKNILIFGATSEIGRKLIEMLLKKGAFIYAVSRKELDINHSNLKKLNADLSLDNEIDEVFNNLGNIFFDAVINFQGVAISSPIEYLSREDLQKQLDISLFSLVRILNNLKDKLDKDSLFINVSSMASFGIFPFISPYSIAKSASDILLNAYEMETGTRCVSIKPGVVGTKFWKFCVDENKKNFKKFKGRYEFIGDFLQKNALKNSNRGIPPTKVADLICKILCKNKTSASYLVGLDSYFACVLSLFKGRFLFKLINKILEFRIKRLKNE